MTEWITIREAANRTGYTTEYLRRLMRENKIHAHKAAGLVWQIDWDDLRSYQERQEKIKAGGPR